MPALLVFIPQWMAHELEALARRLPTTPDALLAAAWEIAKGELHRAVMPAPPVVVLPSLSVPDTAPALPRSASDEDKVRRRVELTARAVEEIDALVTATAHSASSILVAAYRIARDRLHHAQVTS